MAAELRHPATGNPIEVGEGDALWQIEWLGNPVLVVTKAGPDGNALYRLADPRCKTWNRLGNPKNDALARCHQLNRSLPNPALQGGFHSTFDPPPY